MFQSITPHIIYVRYQSINRGYQSPVIQTSADANFGLQVASNTGCGGEISNFCSNDRPTHCHPLPPPPLSSSSNSLPSAHPCWFRIVQSLATGILEHLWVGMHRITGRPDNPAFLISGNRPDTRLPCRKSGKAGYRISGRMSAKAVFITLFDTLPKI
jgi:hypothetical protein